MSHPSLGLAEGMVPAEVGLGKPWGMKDSWLIKLRWETMRNIWKGKVTVPGCVYVTSRIRRELSPG